MTSESILKEETSLPVQEQVATPVRSSAQDPAHPPAQPSESFSTRVSDWLNPIVVKELRQAVQSRFVVAALLILLAIQIVAVGIYLLTASDPTNNFDAGRTVFLILFGILLAISLLFVPLYSGVRLAAERSETNLDLLFITTIKPRSIVAGKLMAAVTLTVLVFSACLPFLTFTYFLRGIDLPSMLVALALGFTVVIVGSQMAIFVGCLPVSRGFKFMIGLVVLVVFIAAYFSAMAGVSAMIMRGVGSRVSSAEFWQWAGFFALVFVSLFGLFFVLSVALISPHSANRALPVRVYISAIWLIGGAAALLGSWMKATHDPLTFWQGAFNTLFGISLFVAVSERDWPGRRVLRAVPAPGPRRTLSFFFFSGSASGLLWTCTMIAATYGVCWLWWRLFPTTSGLHGLVEATRWFTVMCLYLFCYALSGALLRRHVLDRAGAEWTWMFSLALLIIGCVVPFLIGMMVFMGSAWWNTGFGKWLVGNPFVWDVEAHRDLYLSVGIIWATLAVAFNLHWFIERSRAFRGEILVEEQELSAG
jgi:hypothetical protein